ncbi:MAG: DegT/DnrJ/EryC1/StrS family aminotransferase [FCB group bacterium]|nr:DegT/DnrJ/EryC1/StrS family aminotransferase [FCB group bacterium]
MSINIPFGRPQIDNHEKLAVLDVMDGTQYVHGEKNKEFERKFCEYTGAPYAVAVANATAAMHLFWYTQVGPGDEVICPAMTHVATAHAISYTGATPVFVDCELRTGNIDPALVESAITENTKGIAVVHYLGTPVDMDLILKIADKHNLLVLEDCALSLGAYFGGKHTGLWGDAGCFSFYPVKHITCAGDGGMLITRDKKLADRVRDQSSFGYKTETVGFNYRLSEMGAAVGIEQLKKSDEFLEKRRMNLSRLWTILHVHGLQTYPARLPNRGSAYALGVRTPNSTELIIKSLEKAGIEVSKYYQKYPPFWKCYQNMGYFNNACVIAALSISLPVGPHLDLDDMIRIGETVAAIMEGYK